MQFCEPVTGHITLYVDNHETVSIHIKVQRCERPHITQRWQNMRKRRLRGPWSSSPGYGERTPGDLLIFSFLRPNRWTYTGFDFFAFTDCSRRAPSTDKTSGRLQKIIKKLSAKCFKWTLTLWKKAFRRLHGNGAAQRWKLGFARLSEGYKWASHF